MEIKLLVLEGKHKDRVIPLPETIFLIGRDPQCHIRPHCELVSQLHCAIAAWGGKVRVRDLKSKNGTLLNGQPIHGEAVVSDGDRLQVGTLVFAVQIKNEQSAPMPEPIKDERDLQWLLESRPDSSILSPACHTVILPAPGESPDERAATPEKGAREMGGGAAAASPRGSKAVSAGQHLRDYVENRKRRPRGRSKK